MTPPVDTLLRFDPEYLRLWGEDGRFVVAEIPENRYRPFSPPKLSEHLIHLLWRNGLYDKSELKTAKGWPLKIVSAGRFNRAAGPDFKNAVIMVGDEKLVGDVEIHKNAKEWYEHRHHLSPLYNGTVLHVVLERTEPSAPAKTLKGKALHELELGLYMRHPIEELHEELESAQTPVTCRAAAAPCRTLLEKKEPADIARLLDLVGDGRMLIKSNRIMDRMEKAAPSQVLYEAMFACMGYSRYNVQFGRIARKAGKEAIGKLIAAHPSLPPHLCAQAAYFALSGLAAGREEDTLDDAAGAFLAAIGKVDRKGITPLFSRKDWPLAGCRPANYPERRIAAFSHIAAYGLAADQYKELLVSLPVSVDVPKAKTFVKCLLERFTGIADPFWDTRYSVARPARKAKKLVGKDKALSLVVDCIIPFFLAVCRRENDTAMEHRLVTLYHSLPLPASNAVVDYMERNMIGKENRFAVRSVRHQQALLQLYKDFCHRAPAGCDGCAFVEYLKIFK